MWFYTLWYESYNSSLGPVYNSSVVILKELQKLVKTGDLYSSHIHLSKTKLHVESHLCRCCRMTVTVLQYCIFYTDHFYIVYFVIA